MSPASPVQAATRPPGDDAPLASAQPLRDPLMALIPELRREVVCILVAHDKHAGIKLCQVSRSWRRAVIQDPAAWCSLELEQRPLSGDTDAEVWLRDYALPKAEKWLDRSRDHLVHLVIEIVPSAVPLTAHGDLRKLAQSLARTMPRLQHLRLMADYNDVCIFVAEWQGRCESLRALEIVSRTYPDQLPTSTAPALCYGLLGPTAFGLRSLKAVGPSMRRIDISAEQACDICTLEIWSNRSVSRDAAGHDEQQAGSTVRHLLSWMPLLENLELGGDLALLLDDGNAAPVETPSTIYHHDRVLLPHLTDLYVHHADDPRSRPRLIKAPKLESLTFNLESLTQASAMTHRRMLVDLEATALTTLRIDTRDDDITPAALRTLLSDLPRLKHLSLNEEYGDPSGIFTLLCLTPGLLPCLTSFVGGFDWDTDLTDLMRVIEFRNGGDVHHILPPDTIKDMHEDHKRLIGENDSGSSGSRTARQRQAELGLQLAQVQSLELQSDHPPGHFYEGGCSWLRQHIPSVEHFDLYHREGDECQECQADDGDGTCKCAAARPDGPPLPL